MATPAQIAAQLGAAIPSGAFVSLDEGIPDWVTLHAEQTWAIAMGGEDARKLAREILEPIVRNAARELAAQLTTGKVAAAIGPAVLAAVPIVGQAAAAVAYFAKALARGADSLQAQRDIMREGKRETLIRSALGFKGAQVHGFAGPWDARECDDWRTPFRCRDYSFWIPPPGYSPILEITPCAFPAWNPYHAPGAHSPPRAMRSKSEINDLLVAAQLEAWSSPAVLSRTSPELLSTMFERIRSTRAGDVIRFRDARGNVKAERRVEEDELELWRAGVGGVAAARDALFRENPAAVRAALTRESGPPGARVRSLDESAPADALEVARSAPESVSVSLSPKVLEDLEEDSARRKAQNVFLRAAPFIIGAAFYMSTRRRIRGR